MNDIEYINQLKIIEQLIQEELERATNKFKPFNSPHEGWAVIQEEIEELNEEVKALNEFQEKLWQVIKNNNTVEQKQYIKINYATTLNLIKEAIQIAAMIKRYNMDIKL